MTNLTEGKCSPARNITWWVRFAVVGPWCIGAKKPNKPKKPTCGPWFTMLQEMIQH